MKFNVNEPKTLLDAKTIIEDKIFSISRVVKLTDRLAKVRETSETQDKRWPTEVSHLTDIAVQHALM